MQNGEDGGTYFGLFFCLQALERIPRKNNDTIMLTNFVQKICALFTGWKRFQSKGEGDTRSKRLNKALNCLKFR